jgi:adenylate cyclase
MVEYGTDSDPTGSRSSVEIERTYLLDGLPTLPVDAARWRIEQGYLPKADRPPGVPSGRLRRIESPSRQVRFIHTIKRGKGLVRTEVEREITRQEFEQFWPWTANRRLSKTRYVVRCDEPAAPGEVREWEIDAFDKLPLVLAEVELPSADAPATIPDWLRPHIVREVTEEKQYRNYQLALKLAALRHGKA